MSIRVLDTLHEPHLHEVRDDIESAIWVLVYMIVKYARNTLFPQDRAYFLGILEYNPQFPAHTKKFWLRGARAGGRS